MCSSIDTARSSNRSEYFVGRSPETFNLTLQKHAEALKNLKPSSSTRNDRSWWHRYNNIHTPRRQIAPHNLGIIHPLTFPGKLEAIRIRAIFQIHETADGADPWNVCWFKSSNCPLLDSPKTFTEAEMKWILGGLNRGIYTTSLSSHGNAERRVGFNFEYTFSAASLKS